MIGLIIYGMKWIKTTAEIHMYPFVAARYHKSQTDIYGWYQKICGSIDRYHDRHLVWFIQLIDYTDI